MTIKQMNEKQLAEWFQNTRKESQDSFEDLNSYGVASDERLRMAEKIADSNLSSATQKALFDLQDWRASLSTSLKDSTPAKESWFERVFLAFAKPAMAMAFVAGFVVVLMNDSVNQKQEPVVSDRIMFVAGFDKSTDAKSDLIKSNAFDSERPDVIKSNDFG